LGAMLWPHEKIQIGPEPQVCVTEHASNPP
jgi:hypothetical protein